jgi:tetratricopeptide (TPR) repeat protein
MKNAELKINKASLLIEACKLIEQLEISAQNQDVQGDLYEYLLSKLSTAGRNGQFRTPRHIIRLMVQMIAPKPNERIADLAAGTGGFLVNAYQYILEQKTSPENLTYDAEGWPHHLTGELLTDKERRFLHTEAFHGYDNDSGMTMLRIGSMNLILHGIGHPHFYYMDTLSKEFNEAKNYDVILMNPPSKGAVDPNDIHPTLASSGTKKSELLFLHLILRVLDIGGRSAVIIPDGVLFGSSNAHVAIRKKLAEQLDAENAMIHNGKGKTLYKLHFYEDALAAHDEALRIDPNLAEAYRDKADILEALAMQARAKADQIDNQQSNTPILPPIIEKEESSIRLGKMISSGKIQVGERVYVSKKPDQLAKIIDGRTVEFQGKRVLINEWAKKMAGWPSISIYNSVYLERTRAPLVSLNIDNGRKMGVLT